MMVRFCWPYILGSYKNTGWSVYSRTYSPSRPIIFYTSLESSVRPRKHGPTCSIVSFPLPKCSSCYFPRNLPNLTHAHFRTLVLMICCPGIQSKLKGKLYSKAKDGKWSNAAQRVPFSFKGKILIFIPRLCNDFWSLTPIFRPFNELLSSAEIGIGISFIIEYTFSIASNLFSKASKLSFILATMSMLET